MASYLCKRWLENDLCKVQAASSAAVATAEAKGWAPRNLMIALVGAEDKRFCDHRGIDCIAVLRVLTRSFFGFGLTGASTIEQQLVRTIRRRYERKLRRKLSEILLAIAIQQDFNKQELLQTYLEIAYFGWRMNGYRQALTRLGLSEGPLELEDSCRIAAMLKYPMPKEPSTIRIGQIEQRASYVLRAVARIQSRLWCVNDL